MSTHAAGLDWTDWTVNQIQQVEDIPPAPGSLTWTFVIIFLQIVKTLILVVASSQLWMTVRAGCQLSSAVWIEWEWASLRDLAGVI